MTLNFFVITEESIGEILKFFKKYEIATGATINISKKIITPLANTKLYNLDKKVKSAQINNPKTLSKYLAYTSRMIYKKLVPIAGNYVNPY